MKFGGKKQARDFDCDVPGADYEDELLPEDMEDYVEPVEEDPNESLSIQERINKKLEEHAFAKGARGRQLTAQIACLKLRGEVEGMFIHKQEVSGPGGQAIMIQAQAERLDKLGPEKRKLLAEIAEEIEGGSYE